MPGVRPRQLLGILGFAALAALAWWWSRAPRTTSLEAHRVLTVEETGADELAAARTIEAESRRRAVSAETAQPAAERAAEPVPSGPSPHVQGIVTGPDDTPLEGVRLSVHDRELHETVSDERGRFSFGMLLYPRAVSAELEGWMQIADPTPQRDRDRAFLPLHVVMTRTAQLEVEVLDAASKPVQGIDVAVEVSPAELHGRNHTVHRSWQPPVLRAETDEFGVASFAEVPAHCRLLVRAKRTYEWTHGLELRDRARDARPIVLEAGEGRRVFARLGSRVRIAGRVLEPDGTPSPGASVAVHALDLAEDGRPAVLGGRSTDAEGRFTIDELAAGPTRRVLVVAESTVGQRPSMSPFNGPKPPDPLCVAWTELELDPAGSTAREVILQVAAMPKLAGVLVDATGRPVSGSVRLVPHDASPLVDRLVTGRALRRDTGSDGNFLFHAVAPGVYDVVGTDHGRASVRARDVAAGTTDLRLELPDGVAATVHVEVHGATPLRQIIVLCTRLDALPGVGDDAPALAEDADYHGPLGWPEPALGLWYGAQEYRGDLGTAMFSSGPIQDGNTETYELSEGLYWIGAKAVDMEGTLCFPIGTGLVRVGAGEHRVRFHLKASGTLEGRVEDAPVDDALCVALAASDGRLIPLDVRRRAMVDVVDLAADGRFRFEQVPTGRFELRVGTADELRSGAARRRQAVTIEPGAALDVTL